MLAGTVTRRGYRQVRLAGLGRRARTLLVHALVAAAFIGPRPQGLVIDHISGDKLDCSRRNLEYVSPKENARRAAKLGLLRPFFKAGSGNYRAKLDEGRVVELRAQRAEGASFPALARQFGVSVASAYRAATRRRWRHVA